MPAGVAPHEKPAPSSDDVIGDQAGQLPSGHVAGGQHLIGSLPEVVRLGYEMGAQGSEDQKSDESRQQEAAQMGEETPPVHQEDIEEKGSHGHGEEAGSQVGVQ